MNSLAHPESVKKLLSAVRLVRWLQIASELDLESERIVLAVGSNTFSRDIGIGEVRNKGVSRLVKRHVNCTESAETALWIGRENEFASVKVACME